jgi:hypothetical protein
LTKSSLQSACTYDNMTVQITAIPASEIERCSYLDIAISIRSCSSPPKPPNKDHQNEGVKGGEGRVAEQEDEGSGGERRVEGEV